MGDLKASSSDTPHLRSLRTIAWLFDDLIRVPGTRIRFGLDAMIGLLPGGGDVIGGAVAIYALLIAGRLGAPAPVIVRMALNVLIDSVIGVIPLAGDLFDVSWKANRRNVALLEEYLEAPAKAGRSSALIVGATALALVVALLGIATGTVWLFGRVLSLL